MNGEIKVWNALRADMQRQVLGGVIAPTAEDAAAKVDKFMKGKPGRHEFWEQWNAEGRIMQLDTQA